MQVRIFVKYFKSLQLFIFLLKQKKRIDLVVSNAA